MPDIVTTRIFADGEKNITAAKMNDIIASSSIQTSFVGSKPVASSIATNDNLLLLTAGGTYAQAPFQKVIDGVSASQGDSEIWSVRLRSYNAIGNPTFEIDQRNVGGSVTNPGSGTYIIDRWLFSKAGSPTFALNMQQVQGGASDVFVPNTNFRISQKYLRTTLTTAQASLGAGDVWQILHQVEGVAWRELQTDVHSVSLMVRSSVAGLKFSVVLRDPGATTKSIVHLCTIPSANTWTLITWPNIPVWPSGNFTPQIGNLGYTLTICLASGTTFTAPAADTWQSGNYVGAPGMSNFAGSAVNSTFDIGFVQHEPGPVCSTLMDKPFSVNLDECLRYYCKSYPYGTKPGTASSTIGIINGVFPGAWSPWLYVPFKKPMAITPTVTGYSPSTGAVANVRDATAGADKAVTATINIGDSAFGGFTVTSPNASNWQGQAHFTADTGW